MTSSIMTNPKPTRKQSIPPPLSPTKPFSTDSRPFGDLTPPSSPSASEERKPAQLDAPPAFKHYGGRNTFFPVNVNSIAVEDSPDSPPLQANTPPLSPSTHPTSSAVEVPEHDAAVLTVPVFRHAPVKNSYSNNINGMRRPSIQPPDSTPKPVPETNLKPTADIYLPPSPALTPSHSSTIDEAAAISNLQDAYNKPPTKDSKRCHFCSKWIRTRLDPNVNGKPGKLTHGLRLHMISQHATELNIDIFRDEVGSRVGEGWIL